MTDPSYPIGKFQPKESYTAEEITSYIARIETLPARLEAAIKGLTDQQLDTPYRDGGWTVRQVVHHVPDSHTNAYIRIKWTLTEPTPLIKAYNEKDWAVTAETKLAPDISINVLKALHVKLTTVMRLLTPADLKKEYTHPETGKNVSLERLVHNYAWHGDHHLAHITTLKDRMGWK
ncbi:MAG: putative metal-dependent hydrolase [Bacteroidota bacterium]